MLRLLHILILFIVSAATAAASTATAGDFDCRWLSHPTPDDTSHVWFSRTIVTSAKDMPRAAYIRVATTGRFVLYVNGRNVSTALFTPDRQKGDTAVTAIAYDVQRFLRTDTNTIALLYCPSMRTRRQVSVCFYGFAADSSHFAVSGTDRPCFALNGTSTPQHNNITTTPLSSEDICGYSPLRINPLVDDAARISRIYTPLLTEQSGDTLTVHLVPNRRHLIRVTLRGCRRGERIRIGNLQYVCTGEMDEQAFTRFSPTDHNTVTISGDRHFCCEQVQEVESICL